MKNLTIFTLLLLFSCKAEMSRDISLDTTKNYPKKEINLSEIIDFEYIKLETSKESLIGSSSGLKNSHISEDIIVVSDKRGGTIQFFNIDGKFINSFGHKGNGNGEYKLLNSLVVDFENKNVYIYDVAQSARFLVYSFDGNYIKTLDLESKDALKSDMIYNYDNDYLIAYNTEKIDQELFFKDALLTPFPYLLISKANGSIKPIDLTVENRFGDRLIGKVDDNRVVPVFFPASNIYKNSSNTIISDFALDTVYTYNNHRLQPLFETKKYGKKYINSIAAYSDRYIFTNIFEKPGTEDFSNIISGSWSMDMKQYMIDRKTGEVCEVEKIVSNDGVEYTIDHGKSSLPNGYVQFQIEALTLVDLYEEGKLSGKLKEIASTFKEDDNPVLVLGKFRE